MQAIRFGKRLRGLAISLAMATVVVVPSQASVTLAEVPLYLTAGVQPNLTFILDDSGSMQWEAMPGEWMYLFPMPDELYGAGVYYNDVPTFDDDNVHNFFERSAANNAVFYNPDIEYQPWSNPDGSLMPNANPTEAFVQPHGSLGRGFFEPHGAADRRRAAYWFSQYRQATASDAWL
jgi:type IV pilus assembly protein PilY1